MRDTWLEWDTVANSHFLSEVMKAAKYWHPDPGPKPGEPGPEGTRRTRIGVRWKNQWAATMREEGHVVDVETQKAMWLHCMNSARTEIEGKP